MINRYCTFAAAALTACFLIAAGSAALAQQHPGRPAAQYHRERVHQGASAQAQHAGPGVLSLLPADSVTRHSVETPTGKLDYTATAGTFSLYDESGERSAAVFYTAFVAKPNDPNRPVTFVFNGGPGAASAFLNLGLVGPRLIAFGPHYDGAKAHLVDNPHTWLGFTDLVLIDPVGTGWSRAARPGGARTFWSVDGDAEAMAKVIALYVAKNGRAGSPKYLLGESYGGFRAVKVARALQRDQGVIVSGIVMVSPMLEGAFQFGGDRFALGAALQLPSLAAAERERKGTFSKAALAQAEHFALTDYLATLAGPPLHGQAAQRFYARVAQMTGLPEKVVARTRGFIGSAYVKSLYAGKHKIASHYDVTFAVDDPNPESAAARGPDPLLSGFIHAFGNAFVAYARDELKFKTEMTYNLLVSDVAGRWQWGNGPRPPSVVEDLRILLAFTPSLRLMIGHGYSDMVTPFSDSRYVLDHIPESVAGDRTALRLYRGGHMFYLDPQSRKAFTADARAMYRSSAR